MRFGPPGARGLRPGRLRCRPARMHSPAPGTRAGTTAPCISRVHYRAAHHLPHGSQKLVCRGRRLTTGTWPSFGEIVCFPSEPFQTTAFRAPERGLVSPGMITEVSLHELVKPWPARSCVLEWGARKTEQVPGQPRRLLPPWHWNCAVHEGSIETSGRDTNVYAKKGGITFGACSREKREASPNLPLMSIKVSSTENMSSGEHRRAKQHNSSTTCAPSIVLKCWLVFLSSGTL
ncbi:uncharacterized protein [Canis lupus baileyi]|uniref:uncharacterized protein n=1 Tax=Canis lupus baileyi TaxID=143281 RepID=UPI003B970A44